MAHQVLLTDTARDHLDDLESNTAERITTKLRNIADWPDHYLDPLKGRDDYKLRVGDYRVLIQWDRDDEILYVKAIGHRRNFYDRF